MILDKITNNNSLSRQNFSQNDSACKYLSYKWLTTAKTCERNAIKSMCLDI